MVDLSTKVIVIGTLGIGKSTLMNVISGQQPFKTSNQASGCTQTPSQYNIGISGQSYSIVDTPGLNDPEMPLNQWLDSYKKFASENTGPVGLTLVAFKQNVRPSNEQKLDVLTTMKAVKNISADNFGVIFTFCEDANMKEDNQNGVPKWEDWFNMMKKAVGKSKGADALLNMPENRIFFFSGGDGKSGPATTQSEIQAFIDKNVNKHSTATLSQDVKLSEIAQGGGQSMDMGVIELIKDQMKQMKEMADQMNSQNQTVISELKEQLKKSDTTMEEFKEQIKEQQEETRQAYEDLQSTQQSSNAAASSSSSCFASGTSIYKLQQGKFVVTMIENIKEGDFVLAQTSNGSLKAEEVIIKEKHETCHNVFEFVLSNGKSIRVTGNHVMYICNANENVTQSAPKWEQILPADQIQVGMNFRSYDANSETISIASVIQIKECSSNSVYNIVVPSLNVIADDIVVSCIGPVGAQCSPYIWNIGIFMTKCFGASVGRMIYHGYDQLSELKKV